MTMSQVGAGSGGGCWRVLAVLAWPGCPAGPLVCERSAGCGHGCGRGAGCGSGRRRRACAARRRLPRPPRLPTVPRSGVPRASPPSPPPSSSAAAGLDGEPGGAGGHARLHGQVHVRQVRRRGAASEAAGPPAVDPTRSSIRPTGWRRPRRRGRLRSPHKCACDTWGERRRAGPHSKHGKGPRLLRAPRSTALHALAAPQAAAPPPCRPAAPPAPLTRRWLAQHAVASISYSCP